MDSTGIHAPPLRVGFLGQNEMGGAALAALCHAGVTPHLVLTRPRTAHPNATEQCASIAGLASQLVNPADEAEWRRSVTDHSVDVMLCCGWSRRVSPTAIRAAGEGWLNLHPSSLPLWRGSNPIGWQMISGATVVGFTVHRMTAGLDRGDAVARGEVAVPADSDSAAVRRLVGTALGRAAADVVLRHAHAAPAIALPDSASASQCPPAGVLAWLDPSRLSRQQARHAILAFSPHPGVGVLGIPDTLLVVAADRPPVPTMGCGQDQRPHRVEFTDGPLELFCRRR